jgi:hypothetical protein
MIPGCAGLGALTLDYLALYWSEVYYYCCYF